MAIGKWPRKDNLSAERILQLISAPLGGQLQQKKVGKKVCASFCEFLSGFGQNAAEPE